MELTPGGRKAAFTLIVLILAALGGFLLFSRHTGAPTVASPVSAQASPLPTGPAPSASLASAVPASAGVDIYGLLPFSQSDLNQAVNVAQRFGTAYGTSSWQQNASGYVATMRGLVTARLAAVVARAYAAPGVAQLRDQQKQVSAGQATVTALRAFGPSSLTLWSR